MGGDWGRENIKLKLEVNGRVINLLHFLKIVKLVHLIQAKC